MIIIHRGVIIIHGAEELKQAVGDEVAAKNGESVRDGDGGR